mmetsp:Transcript_16879/g.42174  ORF Transcript_16879/g.42174 Transcript_16879/m.42174 type:complete len:272 (-) Transcript_16879:14-829(-)
MRGLRNSVRIARIEYFEFVAFSCVLVVARSFFLIAAGIAFRIERVVFRVGEIRVEIGIGIVHKNNFSGSGSFCFGYFGFGFGRRRGQWGLVLSPPFVLLKPLASLCPIQANESSRFWFHNNLAKNRGRFVLPKRTQAYHPNVFKILNAEQHLHNLVLVDVCVLHRFVNIFWLKGAINFFLIQSFSETVLHVVSVDRHGSLPECVPREFALFHKGNRIVGFEFVDASHQFLADVRAKGQKDDSLFQIEIVIVVIVFVVGVVPTIINMLFLFW